MVRVAPPTAGREALYFHCAPRVLHPSTRIYVRLLGPCFKTGRAEPFRQHRETLIPQSAAEHRSASKHEDTPNWEDSIPYAQRYLPRPTDVDTCTTESVAQLLAPSASLLAISSPFHSLFKVLFIFPSRYLFAIGLLLIFSFRWNLPPT